MCIWHNQTKLFKDTMFFQSQRRWHCSLSTRFIFANEMLLRPDWNVPTKFLYAKHSLTKKWKTTNKQRKTNGKYSRNEREIKREKWAVNLASTISVDVLRVRLFYWHLNKGNNAKPHTIQMQNAFKSNETTNANSSHIIKSSI